MPIARPVVLSVLPLLLSAGGCKTLVRDDVDAVAYHPGVPPTTVVAPCDGVYRLYDCARSKWASEDVAVAKGETVGFRYEPNLSLVACAGDHVAPLPIGPHAWKRATAVTRWDRTVGRAREGRKAAALAAYSVATFPIHLALWAITAGAIAEL